VNAILKITDPSGHLREFGLEPSRTYTMGRSKENDIVLNDRRVSRKHAHIVGEGDVFKLVDGFYEDGKLVRSVNRILVNSQPQLEHVLGEGDRIRIGETEIEFREVRAFNQQDIQEYIADQPTNLASHHIDLSEFGIEQTASRELEISLPPVKPPTSPLDVETEPVKYDDSPLGHTQLQISANEIIGRGTQGSMESPVATPEEIRVLRRKAKMLELVYEMSQTLYWSKMAMTRRDRCSRSH
jgi:predicted component of type VI protein secretion system